MKFDTYGWVAFILVLIGGICWGIVGVFNASLMTAIFGAVLGRIIYIIVGIAALYLIYAFYVSKKKPTQNQP